METKALSLLNKKYIVIHTHRIYTAIIIHLNRRVDTLDIVLLLYEFVPFYSKQKGFVMCGIHCVLYMPSAHSVLKCTTFTKHYHHQCVLFFLFLFLFPCLCLSERKSFSSKCIHELYQNKWNLHKMDTM